MKYQNFATRNVLANSTNIAASFRVLVKNPVHASLIQLAEMTRSKHVKCESESHERYDCCSADNPVDGFDASRATTARGFTPRLCKRTTAHKGSTTSSVGMNTVLSRPASMENILVGAFHHLSWRMARPKG